MSRRLTLTATIAQYADGDGIVCPACGEPISLWIYRGEGEDRGGIDCPACHLSIDLQFEPAPDETEE